MSSQRASSPNFLDSPPPASPTSPGRPATTSEPLSPTQPILRLQHSETYTQHINENTNDSTSTIHYEVRAAWNDESSEAVRFSPTGYDIQPWNPDDNSHSSQSFQQYGETSAQLVPRLNVPEEIIENDSSSLPPVPVFHNEDSASRHTDTSAGRSEYDDEEPPAKIRKVCSPSKSSDEQDGESCPICLDTWGNSGEHRVVALKCGHLFGLNCVERWLRAKAVRKRTCPTCKSHAAIKDIRPIYVRRLVAADTSEITTLQNEVETLKAEKSRTELELQKAKVSHRMCLIQLENLRNSLMSSNTSQQQPRRAVRFSLEKNLEICRDGGCRVLAYNCRTYDLYVSQKSTNNLFPGFGVRRVGCVDFKLGHLLNLHPKPIRDLSYSQPLDLLVSASLDGTARIVERGVATATIHTGVPLWSCTWDVLRDQDLFLGGVGGTILHYDIRNTGSPLDKITASSDITPVASMCSTEFGLLSCQLNSCWLWSPGTSSRWSAKVLPVEGPFLSMAYDRESRRALVSCRPKGMERSKLVVNKFQWSSEETLCEVEQMFNGSSRASLMSRVSWVKGPGTWVAAHSESDAALILHGLEGSRTLTLPATEPALDVFSTQLNGDTVLATLSESRLRVYKAVCTNS